MDLGSKRIGLALSDPDGLFASPLLVLQRQGGKADLAQVARLAEEYEAEAIVVGMPLNLRGERAEAASHAADEIKVLRRYTVLPIHTYDERLTSAAAGRALQESGLDGRQRRQVTDKVAAALMLQSFLDRLRYEHEPETQA